jgi:hypothetical protein
VRRRELFLQLFPFGVTAEEEIAVDALEVAVDILHRHNAFDSVDGGHVTFSGDACAILPVHLLDPVVAVVERGREMRGSAPGFAASNRAIVDQDHSTTGASEEVRRCHAGDAGADHADVCAEILAKRLELWNFGCAHPDGRRVAGIAAH